MQDSRFRVFPGGSRTGVVWTRFFRDFVFLAEGEKRFQKGSVEIFQIAMYVMLCEVM